RLLVCDLVCGILERFLALVGPRSRGCNPPLSCGGSRPLPSVEMRQRWLQRKWFALLRFRAALAGEASLDEAAQRAKSAASFKGGMRTLGARLMDHSTCTGLFGPTRRRARPRGHRRGKPGEFRPRGAPVATWRSRGCALPASRCTDNNELSRSICGGRISAISSRCRDITRRLSDTQFG